jgi:hypothetical protein
MCLMTPIQGPIVAQVFMDNIFKVHGMPKSIVFDCDPTFPKKKLGFVLSSRYPIEFQHNISLPNT